jgi:hypothetical protein
MAVLYLIGVLEDGVTPRSPEVPENVRQELAITQATTAQIVLSATNPGGVPLPPVGELILTVKPAPWLAGRGAGTSTMSS